MSVPKRSFSEKLVVGSYNLEAVLDNAFKSNRKEVNVLVRAPFVAAGEVVKINGYEAKVVSSVPEGFLATIKIDRHRVARKTR